MYLNKARMSEELEPTSYFQNSHHAKLGRLQQRATRLSSQHEVKPIIISEQKGWIGLTLLKLVT
jgi:hypothetical protein